MPTGHTYIRIIAWLLFNFLIILCFGYYLGASALRNVLLETTALAEYLDENDFYHRVYGDQILQENLRGPTSSLTGGFNLSDDDRSQLLRQVIPPDYLRTEVQRNLKSIQRFLDGQPNDLDLFLDLSRPVDSVKPAVLELLDHRIDSGPTTAASSPEELAEQIETFLIVIGRGRIPSLVPSSDSLSTASLSHAYQLALDSLMQQPSAPQEAVSNLQSQRREIIDALGGDDARASLKLASRSAAEPRIDESIAELREALDERDRFDFLTQIANEQNQTRVELLDDFKRTQIAVNLATSVAPILALGLMAFFSLLSGLIFFPQLKHIILWPSATLLITGLLFLLVGLLLTVDFPSNVVEECNGLTSSSCSLTLDIINAITSDIGSVFIQPSAIVAIIGGSGILLSILLSVPQLVRYSPSSEVAPLMKASYLKVKSGLEHFLFEFHLTRLQQIVLFVVLMGLLAALTILVLPFLVIAGPLGYMAGFVINFLSNATVMIPIPGNTVLFLMVRELNPYWLGVVAGIGGTSGELTGYWLGTQGRESLEGTRMYQFAQRSMERYGGLILVLFGLIPILPDDVVAIIGGATRYPIAKFLFYVGIGKVAMTVGLLYAASEALEWAEPFLRWLL